jgi:hypothetical protein
LLGTAEPIIALWCWAGENATDGDLSGFSVDEIEDAALWRGERGKAFKAMCDSGFIDVSADVSANKVSLHEWGDTTGAKIFAYLHRKERQRDLMRARRSGSGDPDQKEKERDIRDKTDSNQLALTCQPQPSGSAVLRRAKKHADPTPGFRKFWEAYPRKVAKGQALKAWPGDELTDVILSALAWQTKTWGDIQYVKHPATWLNARCWEDEKPKAQSFQTKQRDWTVGGTRAEECQHPDQTGEVKL